MKLARDRHLSDRIRERMPAHENPGDPQPRDPLAALLRRALLLDLEVSDNGSILRIGVVSGAKTFALSGSLAMEAALEELSALAEASSCVLGHNLVRHDLRVLRQNSPRHALLRLPVIDTLVLSP